jgi:hypothetical protein
MDEQPAESEKTGLPARPYTGNDGGFNRFSPYLNIDQQIGMAMRTMQD